MNIFVIFDYMSVLRKSFAKFNSRSNSYIENAKRDGSYIKGYSEKIAEQIANGVYEANRNALAGLNALEYATLFGTKGKIPKWGGFKKEAKRLGGTMLNEAVQEDYQQVVQDLETRMRGNASFSDYLNPSLYTSDEALYAAALGAASGGLFHSANRGVELFSNRLNPTPPKNGGDGDDRDIITANNFDTNLFDKWESKAGATDLDNVLPEVKGALNNLARELGNGGKIIITGGAEKTYIDENGQEKHYHAEGEFGHEGGWKIDIDKNSINDPQKFFELCKKYGFAVGDEGDHYDLSAHKQGGVGGTVKATPSTFLSDILGGGQGTSSNGTMTKEEQIAAAISKNTGIPADWIWAQMYHETGGFSSELAKLHNYGGVKGAGNRQTDSRGHSYFDSDEDYVNYMSNYYKKYAEDGLLDAKTPEEFVHALKKGGYFTDDESNYLNGVKSALARRNGASISDTNTNTNANGNTNTNNIDTSFLDETTTAEDNARRQQALLEALNNVDVAGLSREQRLALLDMVARRRDEASAMNPNSDTLSYFDALINNENYEAIKNIFPQDFAQIVGMNNEASVDQMREAINSFIDEGLNSGSLTDPSEVGRLRSIVNGGNKQYIKDLYNQLGLSASSVPTPKLDEAKKGQGQQTQQQQTQTGGTLSGQNANPPIQQNNSVTREQNLVRSFFNSNPNQNPNQLDAFSITPEQATQIVQLLDNYDLNGAKNLFEQYATQNNNQQQQQTQQQQQQTQNIVQLANSNIVGNIKAQPQSLTQQPPQAENQITEADVNNAISGLGINTQQGQTAPTGQPLAQPLTQPQTGTGGVAQQQKSTNQNLKSAAEIVAGYTDGSLSKEEAINFLNQTYRDSPKASEKRYAESYKKIYDNVLAKLESIEQKQATSIVENLIEKFNKEIEKFSNAIKNAKNKEASRDKCLKKLNKIYQTAISKTNIKNETKATMKEAYDNSVNEVNRIYDEATSQNNETTSQRETSEVASDIANSTDETSQNTSETSQNEAQNESVQNKNVASEATNEEAQTKKAVDEGEQGNEGQASNSSSNETVNEDVETVKKSLVDLAEDVWKGSSSHNRVSFKPSKKLKDKAKELFGHDIDEVFITSDDVRHIKKHHSEYEEKRGQKSLTPKDFANIYDAVNDFESATLEESDKQGNKKMLVVLNRDGKQYALLIERGKNKAEIKTAYKKLTRMSDVTSPEPNVRNDSKSTIVDSTIPQTESTSKKKSQNKKKAEWYRMGRRPLKEDLLSLIEKTLYDPRKSAEDNKYIINADGTISNAKTGEKTKYFAKKNRGKWEFGTYFETLQNYQEAGENIINEFEASQRSDEDLENAFEKLRKKQSEALSKTTVREEKHRINEYWDVVESKLRELKEDTKKQERTQNEGAFSNGEKENNVNTKELPRLKGSEKQRAWAEEIRDRVLDITRNTPAKGEKGEKIKDLTLQWLEAQTDSSFWIEHLKGIKSNDNFRTIQVLIGYYMKNGYYERTDIWQRINDLKLHQDERGIYDTANNIVTLTENADESTFIHEMGHHYYNVLKQAAKIAGKNSQAKKDLDTIDDWTNYKKGMAAEYEDTASEKEFADLEKEIIKAEEKGDTKKAEELKARWKQERWARGVEEYLSEGIAPTAKLRKIFNDFKKWLKEIYRGLKGAGAKPSDDVRAVMERMIASDKEILTGKATRLSGDTKAAYDKALADLKAAGVKNAEANAYLAAKMAERLSSAYKEAGEYRSAVSLLPEIKNNVEFNKNDPSILHQFAGEKSKTANINKLNEAKEMEKRGESKEDIYKATGWIKGKDDKWRYEIPDNLDKIDFKFLSWHKENEAIDLEAVYDNEELYAAYPWLRELPVAIKSGDRDSGSFIKNKQFKHGAILISKNAIKRNSDSDKAILLHEIQHAIQEEENFARGGNSRTVREQIQKEIDRIQEQLKTMPTGDVRAKLARRRHALQQELKFNRNDFSRYFNLGGEQEARETERRAKEQQENTKQKKEYFKAKHTLDRIVSEQPKKIQDLVKEYMSIQGYNERKEEISELLPVEVEEAIWDYNFAKFDEGLSTPIIHSDDAIIVFGEQEFSANLEKSAKSPIENDEKTGDNLGSRRVTRTYNDIPQRAKEFVDRIIQDPALTERITTQDDVDTICDKVVMPIKDSIETLLNRTLNTKDANTQQRLFDTTAFYVGLLDEIRRGYNEGGQIYRTITGSPVLQERAGARGNLAKSLAARNEQLTNAKKQGKATTVKLAGAVDGFSETHQPLVDQIREQLKNNQQTKHSETGAFSIAEKNGKFTAKLNNFSNEQAEAFVKDNVSLKNIAENYNGEMKGNTFTFDNEADRANFMQVAEAFLSTVDGDTKAKGSIDAWHGNGLYELIDKFSLKYLGTGEGAQVHGWGLYFAKSREIGEEYRDILSENNQSGHLYHVQIPDEDVMLDEQKKLSEQSEKVQAAIKPIFEKYFDETYKDVSGKVFYTLLSKRVGNVLSKRPINPKAASELLNKHGIKGITYDGRTDGRCYVVFDDNAIDIIEKFSAEKLPENSIAKLAAKAEIIANEDLTIEEKRFAEMGEKLGTLVVWINADPRLNGWHKDGVTFINRNRRMTGEKTFWHESLHFILQNEDGLLSELADAVNISDNQIEKWKDKTGRYELNREEVIEEMLCDEFHDPASRVKIFQKIAGKNPTLMEKIMAWINRLKEQFFDIFRGTQGRLTQSQKNNMTRVIDNHFKNLKGKDGKPLFKRKGKEWTLANGESLGNRIAASSIAPSVEEINKVRKKYEGTDKWLKGPNTNPTKLTEEQWLTVRTPAFKKWFGNWDILGDKNHSKVVDDQGSLDERTFEPLIVYHGTNAAGFSEFHNKRGHHFFVSDKHVAEWYGKTEKLVDEETKGNGIYAAYINMRNPLEVDAKGAHWEHITFKELGKSYQASTDEIADYAKEHGYDGVIIRNVFDTAINNYSTTDEFIVFNSNQIKSATNNIGTFDANNPDIRYSGQGKKSSKSPIENSDNLRDNQIKEPPKLYEYREINDHLAIDNYGNLEVRLFKKRPKVEHAHQETRSEIISRRENEVEEMGRLLDFNNKDKTAFIELLNDERLAHLDKLAKKVGWEQIQSIYEAEYNKYLSSYSRELPEEFPVGWLYIAKGAIQYARQRGNYTKTNGYFVRYNTNPRGEVEEVSGTSAQRKTVEESFKRLEELKQQYKGNTKHSASIAGASFSASVEEDASESLSQKIKNIFTSDGSEKARYRQQMAKSLEAALGVKIRYGKMDAKDGDIVYKEKDKVIRSKHPYDWDNILPVASGVLAKKLGVPDTEEHRNLISNWFLEGTLDKNSAAWKDLETKLNDPVNLVTKTRLIDAQNTFQMWRNKEADEKMEKCVQDYKKQTKTAKEWLQYAYNEMVEEFAPIERMVKKYEKDTGKELNFNINPDVALRLYRGMPERVMVMVNGDTKLAVEALKMRYPGVDWTGFKTLKDILGSIDAFQDKEKQRKFRTYCVACQMLEMHDKNDAIKSEIATLEDDIASLKEQIDNTQDANYKKSLKAELKEAENNLARLSKQKPFTIPKEYSRQDCERYINNGRAKYGKAQRDLVRYSEVLLNILYDSGVKSSEEYYEMLGTWKNYVPLHRVFDENEDIQFGDSLLKRKGSERDIVDPLASIIHNTADFIKRAERNKAVRVLSDFSRVDGTGWLVEEVSNNDPDTKTTVSYFENGKKKFLEVSDPTIAKAINKMDLSSSNLVTKICHAVTKTARACFTTLNPAFILSNIARDMQDAFLFDGVMPWDTVRGFMHAFNRDETYYEWATSGAAQGSFMSVDRDYTEEAIKNMGKNWKKQLLSTDFFNTIIEGVQKASELSEQANRIAVYKKRKGKYLKEKMDANNAMLGAALRSRDLIDFGRHGKTGKKANEYVAFFNAFVQGADKFYREVVDFHGWKMDAKKNNGFPKEHAKTLGRLAFTAIVPAFFLSLLYGDDDDYDNLDEWVKNVNWTIKVGDTWLKIPKGADIGIHFISNCVRKMMDNKKHSLGEYKDLLMHELPEYLPNIALPMWEAEANYSRFMKRDIVPHYQHENEAPKYQYGANTTTFAKWLGEKLNYSPRKIEHIIKGYTGSLGMAPLRIIDVLSGKQQLSTDISGMPLFTRFMQPTYKSGQHVQDFYDKLKEQTQLDNEYKKTKKRPEGYDPAMLKRMKAVNKRLSELNKKENEAIINPKLSYDQRKEIVSRIQKERSALTKKALSK